MNSFNEYKNSICVKKKIEGLIYKRVCMCDNSDWRKIYSELRLLWEEIVKDGFLVVKL